MTQPIFQKALEQLKVGELIGALQNLDQVIVEQPQWADAYYQRGKVHAKLQNFSHAIADYTEAIRLQPTIEGVLNRAVTYLVIGKPDAAIADATYAMQMQPQFALAPHLLGKAYAQLGDHSRAIAAYKQAAQRYLEQQDKDNAHACILQIESLQPQPAKTISPPSSPPSQLLSSTATQAFFQQATVKLNQRQYADALSDILWLLQFEPNHIEALSVLGQIQAKLGNAQASVEAFVRALQIEPDNQSVLFQRGKARLCLGDAHGAVLDFTHLMAQDPGNLQLFLQRGHSYHQLQDWENAFKDYSNAIGICPEAAEAYFCRAETEKAMEDLSAAAADYQQAATHWLNQGDWKNHHKASTQVSSLNHRLKQQAEAKAAAAARIIRIPIKYRTGGAPVIEVLFNGQRCFDMVLDTGAGVTVISAEMARILGVAIDGHTSARVSDGQYVEFEVGWVRSLSIQSAVVHNLKVLIATYDMPGLLGQDFLDRYQIRILTDEVELHLPESR